MTMEKNNEIHQEEIAQKHTDSINSPIPDDEDVKVTFKTWIVTLILSWGYGLSFIPVPCMAAVGTEVATSFGDASAANWFVAAWIISITISFMIAGANTDMLGRRWFLITGQGICFVGHLVTGCAKNNTMVLAGMSIEGVGAALCQMAAFALPELLPNKWRHIGVVLADLGVYFVIIIIPVTARYGFYDGTWRGNFYAAAALQGLSFIGLLTMYYPPAHPLGIPFKDAIRQLDYLGMILFIGGALPVLMGIVWAATLPSSDPHVVAPLVVGFVLLVAFALWETYGNATHQLTPPKVFASSWGRDFTAPCVALAIINMFYYSSSIIWPTMINAFYTAGGQPWQKAALYSIPQGLAITGGAVGLTCLGSKIRHWQWQQTTAVTVMVVFGSLLALATPHNFGLMCAFVVLSLFGYGWAIYLSIAFTQMGVPQEQLGVSGGLSGCVRFAGGSIAQAVYLTVFQNDLAKKTPLYVAAAAERAGVAPSNIPRLLADLAVPAQLAKDFPASVVAAAGLAQQEAIAHGIKLIALTSMGFGIIGIIACLCCKDVDAKMNNKIEVFLENDAFASRNKYH